MNSKYTIKSKNSYAYSCAGIFILSLVFFSIDKIAFGGNPFLISYGEQIIESVLNIYLLYKFIQSFWSPSKEHVWRYFLSLTFFLLLQISDLSYAYNYYFNKLDDHFIYLWITTAPLGISFLALAIMLSKLIDFRRKRDATDLLLLIIIISAISYFAFKLFIFYFSSKYGHEPFIPNQAIRISPVVFGGLSAFFGIVIVLESQKPNYQTLGLGAFIHAVSDYSLRFKSYINADVFYGIDEYTYFIGVSLVGIGLFLNDRIYPEKWSSSLAQKNQSILLASILGVFTLGSLYLADDKSIEFILASCCLLAISVFISSQITRFYIEDAYNKFLKKDYSVKLPAEFSKIQELVINMQRDEYAVKTVKFVSHDLKYPFEMLEVVVDHLESGSIKYENMAEMLYPIRKSIKAGKYLIKTMVEYSDDNKIANIDNSSLYNMIYDSAVSASAMKHRNAFKFVFDCQHENMVRCDESSITRALSNIIFNAMQAITDRSLDYIRIKTREIDSYILVEVMNTGSYVDENQINNMFTQFLSFNKPTGSGLGLAIAKESVELSMGDIWCESDKAGPSTTFYIKLKKSDLVDHCTVRLFNDSNSFLNDFYKVKIL